MIARPKISRNEWKTAEIGAFEVGNFALLCCPDEDVELEARGPRVHRHATWQATTSSTTMKTSMKDHLLSISTVLNTDSRRAGGTPRAQ